MIYRTCHSVLQLIFECDIKKNISQGFGSKEEVVSETKDETTQCQQSNY